MAYSYCYKCDHSMGEPTLYEVVYDDYICPNCNKKIDSPKSLGEFVLELSEKVADLERQLAERK